MDSGSFYRELEQNMQEFIKIKARYDLAMQKHPDYIVALRKFRDDVMGCADEFFEIQRTHLALATSLTEDLQKKIKEQENSQKRIFELFGLSNLLSK